MLDQTAPSARSHRPPRPSRTPRSSRSTPSSPPSSTGELGRQRGTLEMIASENFVPRAVLEAQGSRAHQQVRRGLPRPALLRRLRVRRRRGGPRDRAGQGAVRRRVRERPAALRRAGQRGGDGRPSSTPGDRILGLELAHGGHLTHGMKLNFSRQALRGRPPTASTPRPSGSTWTSCATKALEHRPQVIIAGWSAYPRQLDFAAFRSIADEVGALLLVDMAHFAGLVAAGLHPNPVPHAHVDHLDRAQDDRRPPRRLHPRRRPTSYAKKFNSAVFPGQQGGPLMHVIAAKATAFKIAATPEFKERQERTIRGAQILAERLLAADARAGRRRRAHRRHRRAPRARRPARVAARRQAGRGPPARGRHHREPQRRAVRPAAADGHLGPADRHARRSPPAASATPSSPRSPTSSPTALQARRRRRRRCARGSSASPPTSRSTDGLEPS